MPSGQMEWRGLVTHEDPKQYFTILEYKVNIYKLAEILIHTLIHNLRKQAEFNSEDARKINIYQKADRIQNTNHKATITVTENITEQ